MARMTKAPACSAQPSAEEVFVLANVLHAASAVFSDPITLGLNCKGTHGATRQSARVVFT